MGWVAMAQSSELTIEQHLEDYDFAVKYIEDNYSGFPDKVVDSTRVDYEAMKTRLRNQVVQGERPGWDAATEYMAWFNDTHLAIHLACYDDSGNYVHWSEKYSKKKKIHYESEMEYNPKPVACKVTDKTFLIRFPSCGGNPDMKWIKNSIKQFKKSHCENLILDIRGNTGGADAQFEPYLRLVYDHEMIERLPEYRNTPKNIECVKRQGWTGTYHRLKPLSERYPDRAFIGASEWLKRYKKVDKSVKKAAIIVDNRVASSGEALVLNFKACSGRVTLFGRDNTRGCLDYSNVAFVSFRHFDRIFQMPMSRDWGLPETGIDATGIAPDVRIDLPLPAKLTDNIDEWVIWVAEQLEK